MKTTTNSRLEIAFNTLFLLFGVPLLFLFFLLGLGFAAHVICFFISYGWHTIP